MAYASTPTHGKTARMEKNDVAIDFTDGWNIDFNVDLADTSRLGQSWKESLPGQGSWSGSFSGQLVMGNTEQAALMTNLVTATPGTKLTDIKFLIDGTTTGWSGNVYVESVSVGATVGDKVSVTVNFRGDGAPTVSASQ